MMVRKDFPDVVMRIDGLRKSSSFEPLPSSPKTPRRSGDSGQSPYKVGLRELRETQSGPGTASTSSGNKIRRLTRPITAGHSRSICSSLTLPLELHFLQNLPLCPSMKDADAMPVSQHQTEQAL